MQLHRTRNQGNALKGIVTLLLVMATIVTSPLWYNILISSNESQAKVACMNLQEAKQNQQNYAAAVNNCMADNKGGGGDNQAYFLSECRRLAQKKYPISQSDFPPLSVFGVGDTRAYTEARASGCGQ